MLFPAISCGPGPRAPALRLCGDVFAALNATSFAQSEVWARAGLGTPRGKVNTEFLPMESPVASHRPSPAIRHRLTWCAACLLCGGWFAAAAFPADLNSSRPALAGVESAGSATSPEADESSGTRRKAGSEAVCLGWSATGPGRPASLVETEISGKRERNTKCLILIICEESRAGSARHRGRNPRHGEWATFFSEHHRRNAVSIESFVSTEHSVPLPVIGGERGMKSWASRESQGVRNILKSVPVLA